MKIIIVGPGAIGILFGSLLAKSGQEVVFFDRNTERIKHIQKEGIALEAKSGHIVQKAIITNNTTELAAADLFIICVKSYDTKQAVQSIKSAVGDSSYVLTLQNGVGNVEVIAEVLGGERTIGGVTSQGANVVGYGKVRHAGTGETVIGKMDGKIPTCLRAIREIFNKAGLQTRISKDIRSLLWSKLIINVGINALTAITQLRNGKLVEFEGTRSVLREAVSEAVKVAKKKRIKLIYDDAIDKTEAVCEATSQNISSMLQDVLKRRKTEIDYINGAIVRQGQSLGIATPVNAALWHLVKTIESSYEQRIQERGQACS